MKKIAMIPMMLLALTAMSRPHSAPRTPAPQNNVRYETIVRNDTVVHVDTVITTRKVRRTEVIQRMEEVYYSDSVSVTNGVAGAPVVFVASPEGTKAAVPAQAPVVVMPSAPVPGASSGGGAPTANQPDPSSSGLPARREGGDYIWIPDSLRGDVAMMLQGLTSRSGNVSPDTVYIEKIVPVAVAANVAEEPFDPEERVTFRGDTTSMVLRSRNLGRFDRGLFNYLYIPKGIWSIGVTASYGEFSTEDLEVLDLMSDIDFSGHLFSIRPYFSYFIGNNRSVGMRLGYTSGKAHIGSFKVDIDEDMNFNLHDISYRSESYTAAVTYSQYFGITRRGRFSIFNDVELAFSSGNSDFIRPYGGKLKTTHTNTMEVALNFSPGVSVYIMDPVTFNLSFGVFGVSLRNEKQTVDGVDMGSRFASRANFRFNIFNISFGVAVNL